MSELLFHRSSRCNNGSCLLVAIDGEQVVIGDSKTPGARLTFAASDYIAFLDRIKAGEWASVESCGEGGCEEPLWRRKRCRAHYAEWLKNRDPNAPKRKRINGTPEERFWQKVDAEGVCWEWAAGKHGDGYGLFQVQGKQIRAHRWAYEHLCGPIPEGYQLDHLCRNRACVNPDHLEAVTQQENLARGFGIYVVNSRKTECKNGHPYNEEHTYVRPDGKGRMCRTCVGDRQRARRNVPERKDGDASSRSQKPPLAFVEPSQVSR